MKKIFFFLSLCTLIGLCSCSPKHPAVVENPAFDAWSSPYIEIAKIEMNDTATVFHIQSLIPGNISIGQETYICASEGGEHLTITGAEGIALGEYFMVPDNGISFKLFFPALKPEITKIDFIECENDDCFRIWGIHLLPNDKVKLETLPAGFQSKTGTTLPEPLFSNEPAILSGKLLGYKKGISPSSITVYANNAITSQRIEQEIPVADDGSFRGEILSGFPGMAVATHIGDIFLAPGQEVQVYIDLMKRNRYQSKLRADKDPSDSVYTMYDDFGLTANDFAALDKVNFYRNYVGILKDVYNLSPNDYREYMFQLLDKELKNIAQSGLSENTQTLIKTHITTQVVDFLLQYENIAKMSYGYVNKLTREEQLKSTFKAQTPDIAYYSFLKDILNDKMPYIETYFNVVTTLCHLKLFNLPANKTNPAMARFLYFKEKITPVIGTDKDVLFDIAIARFYTEQIEAMNFLSDKDKADLNELYAHNKAYADAIIAANDQLKAAIEAARNSKDVVVHETPKVAKEKMFEAIMANYKGKVVVVDFWATWCGPCMVAMKAIKPLKEEMKGKDVVFLYITGETSPLANWNKTYPTIHGEHYYVSDEQWEYFHKQFEIPGIPTFLIYDKTGKQTAKHVGFPGVDAMKKEIEKGLKN